MKKELQKQPDLLPELTPGNQVESMESRILELSMRPDFDPDKLEKLINMQERIEAKQAKKDFSLAMSLFQGECPTITQTKRVNFGKVDYTYTTLDEMVAVTSPILRRNGLSISFDIKKEEGDQRMLITRVSHKGGHSESFTHFFTAMHDDARMNEAQRSKSAITFAKRTAMENALGIVTANEDDNARRAVKNPITIEQEQELQSIQRSVGISEEKLLKFLKVESLDMLTSLEAEKAIDALKERRTSVQGSLNV